MTKKTNAQYATAADVIEALPGLVADTRAARGKSLRAVSAETGLPWSIVHRVEHGHSATTHTIATLLRWIGGGTA